MDQHFPLEFTLDDGTQVTVNQSCNRLYDFTLKAADKEARHFTYDDSEEFTDAKEALLDFDQLNALRKFWLLRRNES